MTDNEKKHIRAGIISVLVHGVLLLLLALFTFSAIRQEDEEDGVPVLLGSVEDADGEDLGGLPVESEADVAEDMSESSPLEMEEVPVPAVPEPVEELLVSQETERSIAAEEAKKKRVEEEARKKAAEEAKRKAEEERQKKAEEEAKRKAEEAKKRAEEEAKKKAAEEAAKRAAANNRVAGAFGNTDNKGNSGNTAGNGAQGSPTGNSNVGAVTGSGGTGTSAKVGNRTVAYLAKPQYADAHSEGTVVVSIQVNPEGDVTNATVTSSTTSSAALKNAAIAAAKQSKFSEGTKTESGTITYRFKLQ